MVTIRIDEQLNLVLPIDRSDGAVIWLHAAPISREVFQQHWLVLSKTFMGMVAHELTGLPQLCGNMLRQMAESLNVWDGPAGVSMTLLPEIRRLANVVVPGGTNGASGWQPMPLDEAVRRKMVDPEDADQIEGVLIFFSAAWRLLPRKDRATRTAGAVSVLDASIRSQPLSDFVASLPTLTETASTGATPPAPSSPPSWIGVPGPVSSSASGSATPAFPGVPH